MTEQVVTAAAAGWTVTDETLDRAHEDAIDVFDTDTALLAYDLRARIAAQLPPVDDGARPASDASIDVVLTDTEWQSLLVLLRRAAQWSDGFADTTATQLLLAHIVAIERVV